jgi:hypothetical protein
VQLTLGVGHVSRAFGQVNGDLSDAGDGARGLPGLLGRLGGSGGDRVQHGGWFGKHPAQGSGHAYRADDGETY